MQFITDGPEIPHPLLHTHEEEGVVFFCGAGISYPAGLPGFGKLVKKIYEKNGTWRDTREEKVFQSGKYDMLLDLLERRLPNGRVAMRSVVPAILTPHFESKGALDTHEALFNLARSRNNILRLVTTNFDLIFEEVIKRKELNINTYNAPMLPLAKDSHWNGLVYLHGRLPASENDKSLQHLVLTSGDFGLAYLTEGWAARFVSEMFRNYTVCFVGYSIDDTVLRYMMDALAADRSRGESTPSAYAFAEFDEGEEEQTRSEWEMKGVVPILYKADNNNHHSALHETLKAWGELYRDGITGKEKIVSKYASVAPTACVVQDYAVAQMIWALSDKSGKPAQCFANFNPVPPLEWLYKFDKMRFKRSDLVRFGVTPPKTDEEKDEEKIEFSLLHRPGYYPYAAPMSLVSSGEQNSRLDPVLWSIGYWLTRHLDDPNLLIWLAEKGGQLHDVWMNYITQRLNELSNMEQAKLEEIRQNAPNAIPRPAMCKLWAILLSGRVRDSDTNSNTRWVSTNKWAESLKREGLTMPLRLQLCEILMPMLKFSQPISLPFSWAHTNVDEENTADRINQLVRCELTLATTDIRSRFQTLEKEDCWKKALPELQGDFQHLLLDAIDLASEVELDVFLHHDLPSIAPHSQNRYYKSWAFLIELLRDSWLVICDIDGERAKRIALEWFTLPHPIFKRLALFAASRDEIIPQQQWLEWFSVDNSKWLWETSTLNETMRLLKLQGPKLDAKNQKTLETMILQGPPCETFLADIAPEELTYLVERYTWIRLAKLQSADVVLGKKASKRYEAISTAHPGWRLENDDCDGFSFRGSETGDADCEAKCYDPVPSKRKDLVPWLERCIPKLEHRDREYLNYRDNWYTVCRKHPLNAGYALFDLSSRWSDMVEPWNVAIHAWSDKRLVKHTWRCFAPSIRDMPDEFLQAMIPSILQWLRAVARSLDQHEDIFWQLCDRLVKLPIEDDTIPEDPITRAINHPVGQLTQAVLNLLFRHEQNDNGLLPKKFKEFLTRICNSENDSFRYGRTFLALNVVSLFRIDKHWTEQNLLPLFDWEKTEEAKAMWSAFLWCQQPFLPLLIALKTPFLDTAKHCKELGYYGNWFARLLTYLAMENPEVCSVKEINEAISQLPQEELEAIARTLVEALKGAGDQRENYRDNRILPFWQQHWPKDKKNMSERISESFRELCDLAGERPTDAFNTVKDWLEPNQDMVFG